MYYWRVFLVQMESHLTKICICQFYNENFVDLDLAVISALTPYYTQLFAQILLSVKTKYISLSTRSLTLHENYVQMVNTESKIFET